MFILYTHEHSLGSWFNHVECNPQKELKKVKVEDLGCIHLLAERSKNWRSVGTQKLGQDENAALLLQF
jgi:hypothetical protein